MGKWIAGIIAGIIVGVAIWALTTVLPKHFEKPPPPPPADDTVILSCTPNPPTVAPGETTELTFKVTRGGKPVANAQIKSGNQDWGMTLADGTWRLKWKAPVPAVSGGYVYGVTATIPEHDGGGGANGDCQILIKG